MGAHMLITDPLRLAVLVAVGLTIAVETKQYPPGSLTSENAAVNRTLVSPEVAPDGKVTVRIYAPRASEVLVAGDWLQPPPLPLVKDAKGMWSATIGPLAPDYYLYWFRVDGVMTPDPKNREHLVFVPGAATEFMQNKDVPHGEVRQVWYRSSVSNVQRSMHVYTPPDYDATDTLPVLYLLLGGAAMESTWSGVGRAGFIMDNLLATRKAAPMVVVMPQLVLLPASESFRSDDELLKDVIPYVEKHYRVRRERDGKAVAGFSIGGYQTLRMLTTHPEAFAYFAVWGAPVEAKTVAAFRQQQQKFLTNASDVNTLVKRLWFRIGSEDMGAPHVRNLTAILQDHGIKHDLRVTGGGHRWQNWRKYLHEYAQDIFR